MSNDEHATGEPDLVDKALGALDHVLDVVHDNVIRPILLAGRFIAYAFVLLLVSVVLIGALVIGLVRFCNVYFFAGHDWLSYVVVGALSLGLGLLIWRRRRPVSVRKP